MNNQDIEYLLYKGESPQDAFAFKRYLEEVSRGKSLSQLQAVALPITSETKKSWSPRSFTAVSTPVGIFDATICNISYHFYMHGARFGTVKLMTDEAKKYFQNYKRQAVPNGSGLLRFPNRSLFEQDGRIVTFF